MKISDSPQQVEQLIQTLSELAQTVNAEQLFIAAALEQSLRPAAQAVESEFGPVTAVTEVLAFHLYPHFADTEAVIVPLLPFQVGKAWVLANELFNRTQLRDYVAQPLVGQPNRPDSYETDGFWPGQAVEQARLYGMAVRSSAYPEQTARYIEEIQGRFETTFASRIGISPGRAVQLIRAISKRMQERFDIVAEKAGEAGRALMDEWRQARTSLMRSQSSPRLQFLRQFEDKKHAAIWGMLCDFASRCESVAVGFEDVCGEFEPTLSAQEWNALVEALGMTPEKRASMTSPEEVRLFPLYVMSQGRVLLRDMGHTFDRVWELFDTSARQDAKFVERYQKHRNEWLEGHAVEYLQRLFPTSAILREALYPDPDNPGGQTELDTLVAWGPFLLLVECKAKQFRLDSQLRRNADGTVGNASRLRSDLKANIEDAFQQAQRALNYIEESESPVFMEKSTGRTIHVEKTSWTRIYPVTLSLLSLADIANYRPSLRELGLFKEGVFPLALAASELDIITQFCEGPEVFLHYVERRKVLHELPYDVHSDELDMFGAYLQGRLRQEAFTREEQPGLVMMSGWTDDFDRWMSYQRGDLQEAPTIQLNVPREIRLILSELRQRKDEFARWMAFALLDLSDGILEQIALAFRGLHQSPPTDDYRCIQFIEAETKTIVVLISTLRKTRSELYEHLQMRAVVEQYQGRATRCLGFGIYLPDQSQAFDCAFWREEEWSYNEERELEIAAMPKRHLRGIQSKNFRIPGRNEPCFCGSGKKFKKCCLKRVF
jgi:hypothetical protein